MCHYDTLPPLSTYVSVLLCHINTVRQSTVLPGKRANFYYYLIFDRRHVYLLGNTKNQRNNYKLTDSFEIEPICLFSILCTEL